MTDTANRESLTEHEYADPTHGPLIPRPEPPAPDAADDPIPGMSESLKAKVRPHLQKVQGGRLYLTVQGRLIWFRDQHPDWAIKTEAVSIDLEARCAIFRAEVYDEKGRLRGTGTKFENAQGFPDFVEKAETGSVGRALLLCGFGTAFADDLNEGARLADAPVGRGGYQNDPPRAQNSPGAVARAYQGAGAGASGQGPGACAGCGRAMTGAQVTFTEKKFGRALCSDCQKGANHG